MTRKQKRWMRSAIETAKTMQLCLPYHRGARAVIAGRIARTA